MIMELVLVPGRVPLDDSKPIKRDYKSSRLQAALHRMIKPASREKSTRALRPPGFQLLATCRQICAEGHPVFYSSNIFFLPPGPLENTHRSLKALQPQCRAMIRKVGITMTLQDLTPAVFQRVRHEMEKRYGYGVTRTPNVTQASRWSVLVEEQLNCIWKEKLNYILTHSSNLTHLCFRAFTKEESEESNDEDMTQIVEFFEGELSEESNGKDMTQTVKFFAKIRSSVKGARGLARDEVYGIIALDGLRALTAKVKKGAFKRTY